MYAYDKARKISLICPSIRASSSLTSDKSISQTGIPRQRDSRLDHQNSPKPAENPTFRSPDASRSPPLRTTGPELKRDPRRRDQAARPRRPPIAREIGDPGMGEATVDRQCGTRPRPRRGGDLGFSDGRPGRRCGHDVGNGCEGLAQLGF